jgi:hypothetical protein
MPSHGVVLSYCCLPFQGPASSYCKGTLVVCPVVAVIQWRQEIARFTAPGSLKVLKEIPLPMRAFVALLDGGVAV